ncbi:MAG: branched-chain amino acid ABC transporter permease [Candidatus Rokubacteria bacterium]|nr:branched-chain amino acid ABC transporter permease [Candidatus Rokubacteria bacterium]
MSGLLIWAALAGPLWSLAGAALLPRRYRARRADPRLAGLAGGLWGAALGPFALGWLHGATPSLRRSLHVVAPALVVVVELTWLFARAYPTNPCVQDPLYVLDQVQTGLTVGLVYATMAAGLTLIYSVQRIISFTHGQFVMFGGVMAFLLLRDTAFSPYPVIPAVALVTLVLGVAVAATLLRPVQTGAVERPDEYALLMTFGFGLFLTYALVGVLGSPVAVRTPRYTDRPLLGLDRAVVQVGALRIRMDLVIAGAIGLLIFGALAWLLYRTWLGRSFRAVSMDRDAAAVAGIDAGRVFVLAFGIGTMLAGVAGAALVPTFNFQVPEMAAQTAIRSYVIVVLGGLGSVRGALLGGLFLAMIEALTAGCYPDPSKGATYQVASGLLVFLAILLVRPQGFFGRRD